MLWKFNDEGREAVTVPVKVRTVVPNKLIRFLWAASEGIYDPKTGSMPRPGGYDNTVEMHFEALSERETLARIVEGSWRSTPEGLQSSYQNCPG